MSAALIQPIFDKPWLAKAPNCQETFMYCFML